MIPTIELDREGFREILEKAKKRIPVLYPRWTNFNANDSGMVLLELLAWMREMQEFHMNQIGREQQQVYLKLLGVSRGGRRPAGAVVRCFRVRQERMLPAGSLFRAGEVEFESVEEICLYAGRLVGFRTEDSAAFGERVFREVKEERTRLNLPMFGREAPEGAFLDCLFDLPFTGGQRYSLQFFLKEDYEVPRTPVLEEDDFLPLTGLSFEVLTTEGWRACEIEEDRTCGLLQSGIVRLRMPEQGMAAEAESGRYLLRIRLEEGVYDIPPVLEYLDLNPVRVRQQESLHGERGEYILGEGTGFPGQRFFLGEQGVIGETAEIRVENLSEKGVWETWERVEDFHSSGPSDRHFVIEEETDEVCFGDGICGLAPEGEIRLWKGKRTRGAAGNVKKGQIFVPDEERAGFQAVNEENASGGSDTETPEACMLRIQKVLTERENAVTDADYESMVRRVPGLMIEKAGVIRRETEQNGVTMVVKPFSLKPGGRLLPAYRSNIAAYMEKRRLIGTKFTVVQPEYIPITLYMNLEVLAYYRDAGERIEAEVSRYFKETQAEFGKPVQSSALYSLLESMDCVKRVHGLNMDASGEHLERNVNGDVILPPNGIAFLEQIESSLSYTG